MNIEVYYEVSEDYFNHSISTEDLGYSEKEWIALSKEEKENILQDYIDDSANQPSWIVSSFKNREDI